jgi:hypothetical protein
MVRLRKDCGNCKFLCTYPFICCDKNVETETYYLDREKTVFGCRPKYAYECKKKREQLLNKGVTK